MTYGFQQDVVNAHNYRMIDQRHTLDPKTFEAPPDEHAV